MANEEKRAWVYGLVSFVSYAIYLLVLLLTDLSYIPVLLGAVVGAIVLSIVLQIAVTVRTAREPKDERDREIGHFGEYVGQGAVVLGAVTALVLAMAEAGYFWVANAIYLGFVLSALLSSVARIAAYRWGLPGRNAW